MNGAWHEPPSFTIIGAGPAGLAAAYMLTRQGVRPLVLEQDRQVGGLSKTVNHGGFRCDIGGHRFFTRNAEVERLWHEVLPRDFLRRPRLSRIYYRHRFFRYPLKPLDALRGLGVGTSVRVLGSFAWRRLRPHRPEASLADWVGNRFGDALFDIFFRTYTEKVWGIPCGELSADWAAQRIRNLDLASAVRAAFGLGKAGAVASMIDTFEYPRLGPGQMYEAMAQGAVDRGAHLRLGSAVVGVDHDDARVTQVTVRGRDGETNVATDKLISSMPIDELVRALRPAPPEAVLKAAAALRYRSILTVNLIVDTPDVLPDTWVYLHGPDVRAGRLQLYRNWSPEMTPDPSRSVLGLEYFAWEGDDLWSMTDAGLIDLARADLRVLGVVPDRLVREGFVVRYRNAYPVYDRGYDTHLAAIRAYLARFDNLACVGRYGQFRYNNMDHSILTAMLAVRRLSGENVDPWAVNEEARYVE